MPFLASKRTRLAIAKLPLTLNGLQILLGIFTILALAVVIFIFEEFTAFTDYTQQWIEFNFFIYYWDKLTISRVYLWFMFCYGWALICISGVQLYAIKTHNLSLLHIAPLLLVAIAIITVLGGIVWLIVTAVNYNEGFLATGGFIFERMRFKGNVWKDLIYREQSWKWVTHDYVPIKAPILKIWVHQRERDFSCCGWDSYMDYALGNYTNLPESCCQKKYRVYGCADNFRTVDRTEVINTRGCRGTMYPWYRSGFIENIVMSIIGMLIGAFQFYLYTLNRGEYYKLLDEMDDLRKPMMNTTMSMSTINSKMSAGGPGSGHMINFGPQSSGSRFTPVQRQGSMGGGSMIGMSNLRSSGGAGGAPMNLPSGYFSRHIGENEPATGDSFANPLQSIQNMSGRFGFNRNRPPTQQQPPMISTPSDRYLINEDANETNLN